MSLATALATALSVQFSIRRSDAALQGVMSILSLEGEGKDRQRSTIIGLYDELRPSLYRYLICLGLEPQESDDIIQETFLSLFEHLEAGKREDNLRGWIYRVAHNLSRNLQKRERRLVSSTGKNDEAAVPERVDPELSPEDLFLWREHQERLSTALDQLTEQQRQCLHLRAEGLRYREIANVLGVSIPRVPQLLQRAMSRIMEELYG